MGMRATASTRPSWLEQVQADDEKLGRLLLTSLQSVPTRSGEMKHRLNPRWFEPYADRDALANDVRRLQPSVNGDIAVAVAQFLAELEILEGGGDPDWSQRGR
jgi:hypothetical protein